MIISHFDKKTDTYCKFKVEYKKLEHENLTLYLSCPHIKNLYFTISDNEDITKNIIINGVLIT